MSKRKGDVSVFEFKVGTLDHPYNQVTDREKNKGWEPLALINWLALAGRGTTSGNSSSSEAKNGEKAIPDNTSEVSTLDGLISTVSLNLQQEWIYKKKLIDPQSLTFRRWQTVERSSTLVNSPSSTRNFSRGKWRQKMGLRHWLRGSGTWLRKPFQMCE